MGGARGASTDQETRRSVTGHAIGARASLQITGLPFESRDVAQCDPPCDWRPGSPSNHRAAWAPQGRTWREGQVENFAVATTSDPIDFSDEVLASSPTARRTADAEEWRRKPPWAHAGCSQPATRLGKSATGAGRWKGFPPSTRGYEDELWVYKMKCG